MEPLNLWNDSSKMVGEWDARDNISVDGQKIQASLSVSGLSVRRASANKQVDLYFVQHNLMIDPHALYIHDRHDHKGWCARNYTLWHQPWNGAGSRHIRLLPGYTMPPTTQSGRSMTTGTSFSLGTNVGVFGDVPTAGVSASYSVSNSQTTVLPDVETELTIDGGSYEGHTSFENGVRPRWDFTFPKLSIDDGGIFNSASVESPPNAARSAFQIVTTSIYEVEPEYYEIAGPFKLWSAVEIGLQKLNIDGHYYVGYHMDPTGFTGFGGIASDFPTPPDPPKPLKAGVG